MMTLAVIIAAIAATSVAAAPAGAFVFRKNFVNWVVTGSLTPKKLGERISLPEGSTFNGEGEANIVTLQNITGSVSNAIVFVPPFTSTMSILGVPEQVGTTFTQVGPAPGKLTSAAISNCGGEEPCVEVSVSANANIGLTSVGILGTKVPTHCETSKPLSFLLTDDLTLYKLFETGTTFSGTVTIPPIKCGGVDGAVIAPVLTTLLSGPDNAYSLSFAPPPAPPPAKESESE
jgi:hypothetical protein